MDVSHLAPALLSLSDVVKAANLLANGDKASVKILVNADLEQKCFELDIELVLTVWEKAKRLIEDKDLATAKEIAEWIGIIAAPPGVLGLYRLIKRLRGKKVTSVTDVELSDGRNIVKIHVEGESDPISVAKTAYELYSDVSTRRKAVEVLSPLREEGYDSLRFYKGDDIFAEFKESDVPETDGSDLPEVTPQNLNTSNIRVTVRIRKEDVKKLVETVMSDSWSFPDSST